MNRSWEENELEGVLVNPSSTVAEKSLSNALLRERSERRRVLEQYEHCKTVLRKILGKVQGCPRCGDEVLHCQEFVALESAVEAAMRQNLPEGLELDQNRQVVISKTKVTVARIWHLHNDLKKGYSDIIQEYPHLNLDQVDLAIRYAESHPNEAEDGEEDGV